MKRKKPNLEIVQIRPRLLGYEVQYPGSPVHSAIQRLFESGRLDLEINERKYLADLLAEEICREAEMSSMGAPMVRRILTWIKGRIREDVIGI